MKKIIFSPTFYYPSNYFTGDNVAHYLTGKYLWHVCNITKTGFYQPVYDFRLNEEVSLTYIFYPQQPQHTYFKKPKWIDEFKIADNEAEANKIAKGYDFFINSYRYRRTNPPEVNWGYTPDLYEINLYTAAYTYKAVYEQNIYIDDLELTDKYKEFLTNIMAKINPQDMPIIAIHTRTNDPWDRHLPDHIKLNENLLFELLDIYKDHIFVLVGDTYSWKYFHHPRIKYLVNYINSNQIQKYLNEYNACLQYILSAYFCRDIDIAFIGISGFTLFIESIRPLNLKPPITVFWGHETFTGVDTCIKKCKWLCPEFEKYKDEHPQDLAFQHYIHHFLYYCRDEDSLKPYSLNYPNTVEKALCILLELEGKYNKKAGNQNLYNKALATRVDNIASGQNCKISKLSWYQNICSTFVNYMWKIKQLRDALRNEVVRLIFRVLRKFKIQT